MPPDQAIALVSGRCMNKNFHRVVFNATRGLRMVVQETARSTGRGASKATRGSAGAAISVTAISAALMTAPLHAQIVADPSAPANQRPPVLVAPNGVPVVVIATPSAAGVSRNRFTQFDVDANGLIINNSRSTAQSQLGGFLQGNPYLAAGAARIILNEVNSSNPSYLNGPVEIAGQRAEFILANPSGIQVNGTTFINASTVTLTTGTPQFGASGNLAGYAVRGGTVTIGGTGMDASASDYTAILARAAQINAGLWAKDLKIVTGVNDISADASLVTQVSSTAGTGATPRFALDVAALGGMYSGHIFLVGTEAGLGARNAGSIIASADGAATGLAGAGQLVVTSAGRLENIGTLQASGDMRLSASATGDATACATRDQLAQTTTANDTALRTACASGATNSAACAVEIRRAQAAGNSVYIDGAGNITVNGMAFATAGPVSSPFTTSTAGQLAQSTADGLIVETVNQAVGLVAAPVLAPIARYVGEGVDALAPWFGAGEAVAQVTATRSGVGSAVSNIYSDVKPLGSVFPELEGINPFYVENAAQGVNTNCVSCANATQQRLTGANPTATANAPNGYSSYSDLYVSAPLGYSPPNKRSQYN